MHRKKFLRNQRRKKSQRQTIKKLLRKKKFNEDEFIQLRTQREGRRLTVSHAYVKFTSQLFGGEVVDYNNTDYLHLGSPDIIIGETRQIIEVKSSKTNMKIPTIKIPQVIEYERVERDVGYENHHALWSFNEKNRKSSRLTITHDTSGLLVLSLDVLSSLINPNRDRSLYFGLVLDKHFWHKLLYHPTEGLERLGLDPNNYFIEKKVLEDKKYDLRWKVKPFEMTTIRNKNCRRLEMVC